MSENHVLLATSSPNTGGGSYTDVIFAKDADGRRLMNSVILGEPCPLCLASSTPELCDHKQDELATWKDPKRLARLERIYYAVNAQDIFRGELCTMAKETISTLFPRHLYADLLGSRPTKAVPEDRVSVVCIGVDPAGGGKSEFALTAIGHVPGKREFQVLLFCAETLATPRMEQAQVESMVTKTIDALRSHPRVGPGVPVIVALEACSGDAIYLPQMFIDHDDVLVMNEVGAGKRYGVPKDDRITRAMVTTVQTMLALNLIAIPEDAIALSTPFVARQKTMRDFRESLTAQFSGFRLQSTGKLSGKARGGIDDLLITLMMAFYWLTRFSVSINTEYGEFKKRYGDELWTRAQPAAMLSGADSSSDTNASKEVQRATKRRRADVHASNP